MKKASVLLLLGLAAASLPALADDKWDITKLDATKLPPPAGKAAVTYAKDIRPMLEASCVRCHNGERHKGDLRLDSLEAIIKGGEAGKVVELGASAKSLLVMAVSRLDDDTSMPPKMRPRGGRGPGGPGGPGGPPPGGPGGPPPGGPGGPPPGGPG